MYGYLKQRLKHAIRFRHKRGFGVHSPFMFNLILNVIKDKKGKYQYPHFTEQEQHLASSKRKMLKLIVRIMTAHKMTHFYAIGKDADIVWAYVKRALPASQFANNMHEADIVFIGNIKYQLKEAEIKSINKYQYFIVCDIYKNTTNTQTAKQLQKLSQVSIDMLRYGMYIINSKVQEGHYNIKL
ncbi:MAG: hypothetical protein ACRDDZ_00410 [Marinifilaceae bacterium]